LQLVIEKIPPTLPSLTPAVRESTRSFLESALAVASTEITDRAKLRDFLTRIRAWNLVTGLEWQLSPGTKQTLWSMIARARLMYADDGKIHPAVQGMIDAGNRADGSLYKQQEELKRTKLFHPQAIGAQFISKFDELYFLVDGVYRQTISPDSASLLFLASDRSAADLSAMIEAYARMRFAFALRDTSLQAKSIFTGNHPTEQLLMIALREAPMIKRTWGTVEQSILVLRSFAVLAVKARPDGAAHEERLRKMLDSYTSNVSLVSIYPHVMLLFHYLSQKNFEIRLPFAGKFDTSDLMSFFFYGFFVPLLSYTESEAKLNHFEVIHAFDMAVRTNLFPIVGVKVDDFTSDTVRRLTQKTAQEIEDHLNLVTKRFQESPRMPTFNAVCREMKSGETSPRIMDLEDIKASPYYGKSIHEIFNSLSAKGGMSSGTEGSLFVQDLGLFYADSMFTEQLERVRLDLLQHLKVAESMLYSYTSYLAKYENAGNAAIKEKTAKLTAEIERIKSLRERAMNLSRQWLDQYGECYSSIALHDWDFNNQVWRTEEQYFRQVHRDIKKMRGANSQDMIRYIREAYKFTGLPSNFPGSDLIGPDGYRAHQIDFLLRVARHMTRGLKTETVNVPALAPHLTINYGSKLTLDNQMIRDGFSSFIPFTENEDEFVKAAIKGLNRSSDHFHSWMLLAGGRVIAWSSYIKTLITMYRIESQEGQLKRTVTPEMIMQAHEKYLKLTALDRDDRWFMETLHLSNRFDLTYFDNRVLQFNLAREGDKFSLQDYWGLFDMPVRIIGRDMLGWNQDWYAGSVPVETVPFLMRPRRFGYIEMGTIYHAMRSKWSRGTPLVPFNAELDKRLDARVSSFVQTEIKAIRDFNTVAREYANKAAARPANERPRADITLEKAITSPMVTPELFDSWEAQQAQFLRQTQNCFVQKCEDFQ
jgi:hypothetical protein